MFAKLTTKIAMRKAGIPSNAFSMPETKSNSKDGDLKNAALSPIANPFANLSVPKSWQSWATPAPAPIEVAAPPVIGTKAPGNSTLRVPGNDGRPSVVVFLRHAGCPCGFSSVELHGQLLTFGHSRRKDIPRITETCEQIPSAGLYWRIAQFQNSDG